LRVVCFASAFDDVWEASEVNHQFLFARLLFVQLERTPEPPPLNVLRLPVYALHVCLAVILRALPRGSALHRRVSRVVAYVATGFVQSSMDTSMSRGNLDESSGEYVGTSFEGHNSWEAWKAAMSAEEMRHFLVGFLVRHEDDVAQEGRWRAKMLKRITGQFAQLEARIERMVDEHARTASDEPDSPRAIGNGRRRSSCVGKARRSSSFCSLPGELAEARRSSSFALAGEMGELSTLVPLDTRMSGCSYRSTATDVGGSSISIDERLSERAMQSAKEKAEQQRELCSEGANHPASSEADATSGGGLKDLFSFFSRRTVEQPTAPRAAARGDDELVHV
jgi:hypothetical protein